MSKTKQRLLGLYVIVFGIGLSIWGWHDAITTGSFMKLAGAGPIFVFCGLASVLFPFDSQKLMDEWGVDRPIAWAHFPASWKACLVVGIVCSCVNFLILTV
jgi:hypothetical protein